MYIIYRIGQVLVLTILLYLFIALLLKKIQTICIKYHYIYINYYHLQFGNTYYNSI